MKAHVGDVQPDSRVQVTTDPQSKVPIYEGVGTVTSDSLAGESLKGSGSFGEGNPKAAASSQPSAGSNAATTDTSGARKLDPAVDAEARDAASGWSEQAQLSAGSSLSQGSGEDSSSHADGVSGGYAGATDKAREHEGGFKMPGKNVTEDPTLTGKREFAPVGSKKDPARVAELEQAKKNAAAGGGGLAGGEQEGSKFSGLRDEAA